MKRLALLILLAALLSTAARALDGDRVGSAVRTADTQPATHPAHTDASLGGTRFGIIDIFIDTQSTPLAAWQFDLTASNNVKFLSIEKGDADRFQDPPYYDPAALAAAVPHIIVGAYSLNENLPSGRIHVARLHIQTTGGDKPSLKPTIQVAANKDGHHIPTATITVIDRMSEGAKQ